MCQARSYTVARRDVSKTIKSRTQYHCSTFTKGFSRKQDRSNWASHEEFENVPNSSVLQRFLKNFSSLKMEVGEERCRGAGYSYSYS